VFVSERKLKLNWEKVHANEVLENKKLTVELVVWNKFETKQFASATENLLICSDRENRFKPDPD
jgi:hypothetical protein